MPKGVLGGRAESPSYVRVCRGTGYKPVLRGDVMDSDSVNLSAPPGFRGFDPSGPVRVYQRRLPHWRQKGATYFVTFRLGDSIPQTHLQALKRLRDEWERIHPPPRSEVEWRELAREITNKTEAWLDEGYGVCELGRPGIAGLMEETSDSSRASAAGFRATSPCPITCTPSSNRWATANWKTFWEA